MLAPIYGTLIARPANLAALADRHGYAVFKGCRICREPNFRVSTYAGGLLYPKIF
jgi:hypothetical protein